MMDLLSVIPIPTYARPYSQLAAEINPYVQPLFVDTGLQYRIDQSLFRNGDHSQRALVFQWEIQTNPDTTGFSCAAPSSESSCGASSLDMEQCQLMELIENTAEMMTPGSDSDTDADSFLDMDYDVTNTSSSGVNDVTTHETLCGHCGVLFQDIFPPQCACPLFDTSIDVAWETRDDSGSCHPGMPPW